jgi:hypothetical protein
MVSHLMHPSVRIQPLVSYSSFIIRIFGPPKIPLPFTPHFGPTGPDA